LTEEYLNNNIEFPTFIFYGKELKETNLFTENSYSSHLDSLISETEDEKNMLRFVDITTEEMYLITRRKYGISQIIKL